MAEHAGVVRVTHFTPAAGKRDQLVAALESGATQARQMDGCFGIQICSVRETPDAVASVSRWASQSALDAFLKSTESQRGEFAGLVSGPPVTHHLTPLG